jgi:hypothetical protein
MWITGYQGTAENAVRWNGNVGRVEDYAASVVDTFPVIEVLETEKKMIVGYSCCYAVNSSLGMTRKESQRTMEERIAKDCCLTRPCIHYRAVGGMKDHLSDTQMDVPMWVRGDNRCTWIHRRKASSHCLHGR